MNIYFVWPLDNYTYVPVHIENITSNHLFNKKNKIWIDENNKLVENLIEST